MQRTVAFLLAAALVAPASGAQSGTAFVVAVTVPVHIAVDALDAPAQIELTAQDVARGYVDVAARYRVRHNDRSGFVLEITALDPVRSVAVRDQADGAVADGEAVAIRRPGAAFVEDVALQVRLVLDPATAPGAIALPLRVAATPI